MKKQLVIGLAIAFAAAKIASAQSNDPVVMEFAGEKITKSEFVRSFKQANNINPEAAPTACTYEKRKALEEYVELYANFRLRLYDAYAKKYDTSAALRNEYRTYRHEMALPYLIDSVELENMLRRTYERNHYAIRASHIMIRVEQNAAPKDTLKAYKKAMEIYEKAMSEVNSASQKGISEDEAFAALATQLSEDETARPFVGNNGQKYDGNRGDIGFFTVFQMVPEFENAAYSMKIGEISKPVRSSYGYHIIRKTDKVKAYGNVSFQHIWVRENEDQNPEIAESKINEAYKKIQNGEDFGTVVRNYSSFTVRDTKVPGLMEMPINQMPADYLHEIQNINTGEYTKPFKSPYGWHIVKVLKTDTIPPYEEMQAMYRSKFTASQYGNVPQAKFIEKCKKDFRFADNTQKNPSLLGPVLAVLNDSVFQAKWKYNGSADNTQTLFELNNRKYTAHDFALFIEKTQRREYLYDLSVYMNNHYKSFINQQILEIADSLLELNNMEFRNQMGEFRDGLVIFAYNDENIWSRATSDTAGLASFYEIDSKRHSLDNPEDAIYFWNERARVTIVFIADSACIKPAKALKIAQKVALKENGTPEQIRDAIKDKISRKCTDEHPVGISSRLMEKNDISAPKGDKWKIGVYANPSVKGYKVICVTELRDPELKSLRSARGYYINNYQNELERQLTENLRKKHNLVIHQDVIDSITW